MATLKLSELCLSIKKCINHFYDGVYSIVAETMDVKIPPSGGHCYMELVEKDDNGKTMVAKMRASLWANDARKELPKFLKTTGFSFRSGLKVLVKAKLSYHEVYGFSLIILAIDGTYTLGDIAKRRQELILRLKQEGIFDLNRRLVLPEPVLHIAVVSSKTAAGWGDFQDHLIHNPHQFPFYCQLFPALMQGERAPESIINALDSIRHSHQSFDIVVIIRGGGSESNLQDLETYELAKAVATFPIPIVTGIGHHKDENVLDLVAYANFKTPTAVAEFLINLRVDLLDEVERLEEKLFLLLAEGQQQRNQALTQIALRLPSLLANKLRKEEQRIEGVQDLFRNVVMRYLQTQTAFLSQCTTLLFPTLHFKLSLSNREVTSLQQEFVKGLRSNLQNQWNEVKAIDQLLSLLHPHKILQRGFGIVRYKGKAVKSISSLPLGERIELVIADGVAQAKVETTRKGIPYKKDSIQNESPV